jgi:predicted DNA-binding transcriptional regulator AlpA
MERTDKFLSGVAVRRRYSISASSLSRWVRDETMRFPNPIVIRKKLYFKEADLIAWEDRQALPGMFSDKHFCP